MPQHAVHSYTRRLHTKAWEETRQYWTLIRYWTVLAASIIAPVVRLVLIDGWKGMSGMSDLAQNGAFGLVISLVGTYVISVSRAAKLLDDERESQLGLKDQECSHLSDLVRHLQQPKHPPMIERQIREFLERYPLSRTTLGVILKNGGEMEDASILVLPEGQNVIQSGFLASRKPWLRPGLLKGPTVWWISDEYKPALRDVLFSGE